VTRYPSIHEVLALHERIAEQSGGGIGLRDLGLLESALASPDQLESSQVQLGSLARQPPCERTARLKVAWVCARGISN
jgi:hypothetical protein